MGRKPSCVRDPGIVTLAESLKVLSDPNRLRILCLLQRGERCVCEVERELGISQQLASHHLNVLREAGFLEARKEGTSSYYKLVAERLDGILGIMNRYLGHEGDLAEGTAGSCRAPGGALRGEAGGKRRRTAGSREGARKR